MTLKMNETGVAIIAKRDAIKTTPSFPGTGSCFMNAVSKTILLKHQSGYHTMPYLLLFIDLEYRNPPFP